MLAWRGQEAVSFGLMCLTIAGVVLLLFGSLYPYLMPSTLEGGFSLSIYNASSSHYTLKVMTIAAGIMTPIVIAYQAWTFWVFRKRLTTALIPDGLGLEAAA